ncbi:MAG: histidinol dehydrogenase, partial [Planctomycetes bacterium]|nr:histidinol dehydrogenase [Planctomycetota bacterium]
MIDIRNYSPDDEKFRAILSRSDTADLEIRAVVEDIIANVRARGDEALFEYSKKFDGAEINADTIRVSAEEMEMAQTLVSGDFLTAVTLARVNIRKFHEYQR